MNIEIKILIKRQHSKITTIVPRWYHKLVQGISNSIRNHLPKVKSRLRNPSMQIERRKHEKIISIFRHITNHASTKHSVSKTRSTCSGNIPKKGGKKVTNLAFDSKNIETEITLKKKPENASTTKPKIWIKYLLKGKRSTIIDPTDTIVSHRTCNRQPSQMQILRRGKKKRDEKKKNQHTNQQIRTKPQTKMHP